MHGHPSPPIHKPDRRYVAWEAQREREREEIRLAMETLKEDEEYNWREVNLPSLIPAVAEAPSELERETGERRRGRDIVVAIDHGPNSKHAFDWALIHFCRIADTLHLVHAVSSYEYSVKSAGSYESLLKKKD